jgi:hypothetical protein
MAIGTLNSPLGPHPESDLATDLYSGSTLIDIMTSPITRSTSTALTNLSSHSQ